jgi:hypothetical protein
MKPSGWRPFAVDGATLLPAGRRLSVYQRTGAGVIAPNAFRYLEVK